jgi:hypothetical protein
MTRRATCTVRPIAGSPASSSTVPLITAFFHRRSLTLVAYSPSLSGTTVGWPLGASAASTMPAIPALAPALAESVEVYPVCVAVS